MKHSLIIKTQLRGKVIDIIESSFLPVSFNTNIPCHYVSESINENTAVLLLRYEPDEMDIYRDKNDEVLVSLFVL